MKLKKNKKQQTMSASHKFQKGQFHSHFSFVRTTFALPLMSLVSASSWFFVSSNEMKSVLTTHNYVTCSIGLPPSVLTPDVQLDFHATTAVPVLKRSRGAVTHGANPVFLSLAIQHWATATDWHKAREPQKFENPPTGHVTKQQRRALSDWATGAS